MASAFHQEDYRVKHIAILRAIANTQTIPTLETADASLVWLLIETGTDVNAAFQVACNHGHTDVVCMLLKLDVDPATYDNYVLRRANGHTEIVRLLLELPVERGVNPAALSNYALRMACVYGNTEIVRLLLDLPLDRGVNPAADNNLALLNACRRCHTEIVRLLLDLPLERGVNPAARNNGALRTASANGHTEIVGILERASRTKN